MTYDEFVEHCIAFAWREGDLDLEGKIDTIIAMANSDLRASLAVKEREVALEVELEDDFYNLGDDVYAVKHVYTHIGEHKKLSIGEYAGMKPRLNLSEDGIAPFYAQVGNKIKLLGDYKAAFDRGDPVEMTVVYLTKIPDFKTLDTSWLTQENLALYVYTVMKHACVYLREDERLQSWVALQSQLLETANEDDAWRREEGQQPGFLHLMR